MPDKTLAIAMQDGAYNDNSYLQRHLANPVLDMVSLIVQQNKDDKSPYTVLDCGCAHGAQSAKYLKIIIDGLKKGENLQREIDYKLVDLPFNDWRTAFITMNDMIRDNSDEKTTLSDKIFVSGIGCSFYQRLARSDTVHLLVATNSLHWFPGTIFPPTHDQCFFVKKADENMHYFDESYDITPLQRQQQQINYESTHTAAIKAWGNFLKYRSQELRPGGKCVIIMGVQTNGSNNNILRVFNLAFLKMRKQELIDDETSEKCVFPLFLMDHKAIIQEIEDQGDYQILENRIKLVRPLVNEPYLFDSTKQSSDDLDGDDLRQLVQKKVNMIKGYAEAVVLSWFGHLSDDTTKQREKTNLFFRYCEDALAENDFQLFKSSEFSSLTLILEKK